MKVLLTGSDGQLGGALQKSTVDGWDVIAVDLTELDLTCTDDVLSFVKNHQPELIVNTAAYTAVDKAETERDIAFAVNADAPGTLAKAAAGVGARMIHISTDYVFDGCSCRPYAVDSVTGPLNVYGESKLAGENAVQRELPEHNLIIRTAWLYSKTGNNFVKSMLGLMNSRDELRIVSDQIGSPTSAASLAEAIRGFSTHPQLVGVYHWTDAGVASWYDFAVAIYEEASSIGLLKNPKLKIVPIPGAEFSTLAKRPSYSVLDKQASYDVLKVDIPKHWRQELRVVLEELMRSGETTG